MTQSDVLLTNVAAWGATEGMSRQGAHAAVRRCGIPVTDGKVDPGVASVLYRQRTRPRVKTRAAPAAAPTVLEAGAVSYPESKRREALADAETAEINLALLKKRVMLVDDAVDMLRILAAAVRQALLNLPSRAAPLVAPETSIVAVQLLLATEVNRILTDLSTGAASARASMTAAPDDQA